MDLFNIEWVEANILFRCEASSLSQQMPEIEISNSGYPWTQFKRESNV